MDIFLQQVINGLTLGSVYAVVALGYTMVYGIIQLINFAHGEVVMIGAMVSFSVITRLAGAQLGLPPFAIVVAGVLVAIPVCMAVGYTLERTAYRPLRKAPRLAPLITAIGLSIILQHLAMIVWGRNPIAFPQIITVTPIHLSDNPNGATITNVTAITRSMSMPISPATAWFCDVARMAMPSLVRYTRARSPPINSAAMTTISICRSVIAAPKMLCVVGSISVGNVR